MHILEKDTLPKKLRNEAFYKVLHSEVQMLMKLKHPQILRVLHPLDEGKSAFVMVRCVLCQTHTFGVCWQISEPLLGSLANVMKDNTNLPKPSGEASQLRVADRCVCASLVRRQASRVQQRADGAGCEERAAADHRGRVVLAQRRPHLPPIP